MYNDNFIYIWIPKTGGSSFDKSMRIKNPSFRKDLKGKSKFFFGTYGHIHLKEIFSDSELLNLNKICVCRNPYDRFVSLYFYSVKRGFVPPLTSFDQFAKMICLDKIDPVGNYNVLGLSYCNPQSDWINEIPNVKIYRFENLKKLFSDFKIKEIKINATNHKKYTFYFKNKNILNMINDFYSKDFDVFGYKKIENTKSFL